METVVSASEDHRRLEPRLVGRLIGRPRTAVLILVVLMVPYYLGLLTLGSFDLFMPLPFSHLFGDMLLHLLRGRFDVDPDVIGFEGFAIQGRVYPYFGIFPAIIRLAAMPFVDPETGNLTILSMLIANATIVAAQLAMTFRVFRYAGAEAWRLVPAFLFVALLAGPQVAFLRPSLYQEVVQWSLALAYLFIYFALDIVICRRPPGIGVLLLMATLAGLTLLTRVSTALGLYLVMAVLLLAVLAEGWRKMKPAAETGSRSLHVAFSPRAWAPALVLGLFAGVAGYVNFMRFGNPLKFVDMPNQIVAHLFYPDRLQRIVDYGEFNVIRIWYGFLYYFVPVWTIPGSDHLPLFSGFRHRYLDMVELPPSSFIVSDPLILAFAGLGLWAAIGRGRAHRDPTRLVLLVSGALAVPCLLQMSAISFAFRYRGDFYPLFAFLGFYGLSVFPERLEDGRWFLRLSRLVPLLAAISVIAGTILLRLYDLSPLGDAEQFLTDGAARYYLQALKPDAGEPGR